MIFQWYLLLFNVCFREYPIIKTEQRSKITLRCDSWMDAFGFFLRMPHLEFTNI